MNVFVLAYESAMIAQVHHVERVSEFLIFLRPQRGASFLRHRTLLESLTPFLEFIGAQTT